MAILFRSSENEKQRARLCGGRIHVLGPSTDSDEPLHHEGSPLRTSAFSQGGHGTVLDVLGRPLYHGVRTEKRVRVLGGEWSGGPWSLAVHAMRTMVRPFPIRVRAKAIRWCLLLCIRFSGRVAHRFKRFPLRVNLLFF